MACQPVVHSTDFSSIYYFQRCILNLAAVVTGVVLKKRRQISPPCTTAMQTSVGLRQKVTGGSEA